MGDRKLPPLTVDEVESILRAWGFLVKSQRGSHRQYEAKIGGSRRLVTVDTAVSNFGPFLTKSIKSMLRQSGLTRDQFYGATKATARRARVPYVHSAPRPGE